MFRSPVHLVAVVLLLFSLTAKADAQVSGHKSSWLSLTAPQRAEMERFCGEYAKYLSAARSARASTREVLRMVKAAGFAIFKDASQVKPGARLCFLNRDRALVLAIVGTVPLTEGSRVVAAHQDSPHLDLKGRPVVSASGFAMFKTVYYGGIKKYQWANVPLALIGTVSTTDGRTVDVSLGLHEGEPVFAIPDNSPHSDADLRNRTYTGVLTGEEMDPVAGSIPSATGSVTDQVMAELGRTYGVHEEDLVSAELLLVPSAPVRDVGVDRGLIGGYGQDDHLSCFCAVRGLLDLPAAPRLTALVYLTNFEEVGSVNSTGAGSTFLDDVYAELAGAQHGSHYNDLDLRHALRNARVASSDTCDGIDPLFPQNSEPSNAARLGFGPAIKLYGRGFNAPAELIAAVRGLLDVHGIPWQVQTPRVDIGGGGTIGHFMSAHNMDVIDVGVPILSMHSPFEMSSKVDVWNFYRFVKVFLQ